MVETQEQTPQQVSEKDRLRTALSNILPPNFQADSVVSSLSITDLRKAGLLHEVLRFKGNIAEIIKFAYPEMFKRQLLKLDEVRPDDAVQDYWLKREKEKAKDIENSQRWNNKNNPARFTNEEYERWKNMESHNLVRIMDKLIQPGDSVLSLSDNDPIIPTLIKTRIGKEGEILVHSLGKNVSGRLFRAFTELGVNILDMKDDNLQRRKSQSRWDGRNFVSKNFISSMTQYLKSKLLYDQRYYTDEIGDLYSEVASDFYERIGLKFVSDLKERDEHSVNVILGRNFFSNYNEEEKEETLKEFDRLLVDNGYLVFQEGAREQTLIKYYGEEIFNRGYTRVRTLGINSAQIVVYKKTKTDEEKLYVDFRDSYPNAKPLVKPAKPEKGSNSEEVKDTKETKSPSVRATGYRKPFYEGQMSADNRKFSFSIIDLAKDLGISNTQARTLLRKSVFGNVRPRRGQIKFTPSEYAILKESLSEQIRKGN